MSSVSWIPRVGAEFAGYRLVSLIGHGGMSIVYRAEHVGLGRVVALKLLSPQLSEDEGFRERFQRESRIAAALEHPNVIPVYEAGEEEDVLYIAMRYVDGADLKTRLKRDGPLDPAKAAAIVSQVAAALDAAHERGLVHRDVKPANILIAAGAGVEGSDHAYLSDFGVAKSTAASALTKTGLFVGTADYAAPEQIEGKPLDGRADVYSLGCVAYEALTAAPAYEKDSEVAMMYAHLLEPPPKVTEKRPDLPPEVDDAIARAAAKSPEDRFPRASDFALALKQALAAPPPRPQESPPSPGRETVLAAGPPPGAVPPAPPAADAAAPAQAAPAAKPPHGRSRRTLIALAAAGGAVVLAAILVPLVLLSGGGGSHAAPAAATTTPAATGPTGTAGSPAAPAPAPAKTLLAVLVPSEIAAECTTQAKPVQGALETDVCAARPTDPTSDPDHVQLSFYPSSAALLRAYGSVLAVANAGTGGTSSTVPCASGKAGTRPWFHPTGKRGGRFFCFLDAQGSFVVVWTHEKLGSDDHVDMLATAREPGRAPTIFRSWWNAVNDSIGKCRPLVSDAVCLATIRRITGRP